MIEYKKNWGAKSKIKEQILTQPLALSVLSPVPKMNRGRFELIFLHNFGLEESKLLPEIEEELSSCWVFLEQAIAE